ncbi:sulfatase-like hydrolase/transferase [Paracoccus sp. PAR01]|uniref:sulfatase-like hydrolase/transferase n=1 Tax=Paracoccus sp. PAR01 TaxID=2769282 RepID=UPI00177EBEC7|nr:sulfatase-like hydrolase/transferase [Paracoccus sp. PAR01]MBD9527245.1 sulfatase [Paracoccus sp. PAR01]
MTRRYGLPLAALLILLVLILPADLSQTRRFLLAAPLELALVLALLCLGGRVARWVLAAILSLLGMLKLADLAMISALGRPFNPLADLTLIDAAFRLLSGSFGTGAAFGAGLAAVLLAVGIVVAMVWATGVWARGPWQHRPAAVAVVLLAVLPAAFADDTTGGSGRYLMARFELVWRTGVELRDLRAAATRDPFRGQTGMLAAIDRDVLVIFVESYGRSSFVSPYYAERHLATLRRAQLDLAAKGLTMRSGFLNSPTQGGQSWLAHASVANGLRIGDQAAYQAVLASGRQSLFHHARRMGFATAAVMPGITRPWPEAAHMGFDRVLAAADLGYHGQPFDWVTMPDQFTLAAMDRLLLARSPRPRTMVQVALLSSHAPWTPLARILPWDQIGDGTEFDVMARSGERPEVIWRDPERVRASYRDALDYSLQAVTSYAARHAGDAPLILILGDHQAAPGIALDGGTDVPLHVIGPPELVERTAAWGLQPGLIPSSDLKALPMEGLRDLILGGFDAGAVPCRAADRTSQERC